MQVWSENELVGELRVRSQDIGRDAVVLTLQCQESHLVPLPYEEDDLFEMTKPAVETIKLKVKRRVFRLDDMQIEMAGDKRAFMVEMMQRYRIPKGAVMSKSPSTYETIWDWMVLDLTPAEVEQIFDLDTFTPADFGAPDLDHFARRA